MFVGFAADVAVDFEGGFVVGKGGGEGLGGDLLAAGGELVGKLDEEGVAAGEVGVALVDGAGEGFVGGDDVFDFVLVRAVGECHEVDGSFEFAVGGCGHFALESLAGAALDFDGGGEAVEFGEELVFEVGVERIGGDFEHGGEGLVDASFGCGADERGRWIRLVLLLL